MVVAAVVAVVVVVVVVIRGAFSPGPDTADGSGRAAVFPRPWPERDRRGGVQGLGFRV